MKYYVEHIKGFVFEMAGIFLTYRANSPYILNSYARSIGNYFLAAAQMFFRSLPSAVFLFSSITGSEVSQPGHSLYE